MISHYDIEYKSNLFLDLHLPESDNFDLLIYFHGGGLEAGTRKVAEFFCKSLAENNIATASVSYSLYPNAKFPEFLVDAAESIRYIKDNIGKYGKLNRIFVGGSSAGGYMSMMLCFDDKYLNAVGLKPTDISGYIHDAGQPTAHFNVLRERGIDNRRLIVDETAPLFYIGTNESYSPMLFTVSDNDIFGRYEQVMLTIKTLEHFGHKDNVYLKVLHGGHCEHTRKQNENGKSVFGSIINEFVNNL